MFVNSYLRIRNRTGEIMVLQFCLTDWYVVFLFLIII